MVSSILRSSAQNGLYSGLYVCARCSFRAANISRKPIRRGLGTKWLAKAAEAKEKWDKQANDIRSGKEKSMLTKLEERGLVHTVTGCVNHLSQW